MKQQLRIFTVSVLILFCVGYKINAQSVEFASITIKQLPQSVDEFLEIRDRLAPSPNGGAACFLIALIVYAKNNHLGTKLLTMTIDREFLVQGNSYNGFQPRSTDLNVINDLLKQKPHFFHAYISASYPDKEINSLNSEISFDFVRNPPTAYKEGNEIQRVLVKYNTDTKPRMIKLRKDYKDFWKVYEWSSILADFPSKNN